MPKLHIAKEEEEEEGKEEKEDQSRAALRALASPAGGRHWPKMRV